MSAEIGIYRFDNNNRSALVAAAMMEGIERTGDKAVLLNARDYEKGQVRVAVFYGYQCALRQAFDWQREIGGHAVYVDLGYWGRHDGGRWAGYHKVVVDSRHPTVYFQARPHDGSRAKALGVTPKPWGAGRHILIAGMGGKAALAEGKQPLAWERKVIKAIRARTDRPIIYRPKPSDRQARPLPDAGYSEPTQDLAEVLRDCHAVVTHHSNVAVDGLVAGIPAFVWGGVAMPLASQDLAEIESPRRPEGRQQWVNDIAYTQYSIAEMRAGLAWRYLKAEGLI